ncbi:MAG: hypothetical protein HF962_02505, partial [Sulfurovum sp.]|nr:hypothetical protein [Sulfurovum sp.]
LYIEQNPLKANMVKQLEEYPYSSYKNFLDSENVPECLKESWIVQNYKEDTDAIKALLNTTIDTSQLEEMRKASSLVEAPNINKKPNELKLKKQFSKIKELKKRNKQIVKAWEPNI